MAGQRRALLSGSRRGILKMEPIVEEIESRRLEFKHAILKEIGTPRLQSLDVTCVGCEAVLSVQPHYIFTFEFGAGRLLQCHVPYDRGRCYDDVKMHAGVLYDVLVERHAEHIAGKPQL